MRDEKTSDLDWLAFCYIAGELSADETEAFERRLADDQTAREAIARAVDLTRAIAVVGAGDRRRPTVAAQVPGVWPPRRFARHFGRAAVVAAACLMVVLAYQRHGGIAPVASSPQELPGSERIEASERSADQLAVVWSQTREELAAMQFDAWVNDSAEEPDESDELPPFSTYGEGDDDDTANVPPSWMIAAVRAIDRGPAGENNRNGNLEEN